MDSSRLRTGEIVAGICGIALFVFLFFDRFAAGVEGFDTGGVKGWGRTRSTSSKSRSSSAKGRGSKSTRSRSSSTKRSSRGGKK